MSLVQQPLLSICMPTMNRGGLLELGLINAFREIEPFSGEVELIVSDNGFTEPLPIHEIPEGIVPAPGAPCDVDEMARRISPLIRYIRVEGAPLVFSRSFQYGAQRMARGKYVWIVGDDDLIVRGGVKRILDFLREHPDLDYIYLNIGWIPLATRNHQILHDDSAMPIGLSTFQCHSRESRVLERLEDLISMAATSPYSMFSTIFCYVTRRELYLEHQDLVHPSDDWLEAIQNLDNLFPHSKLTMSLFAGKPVGYIGEPCVLQGSYHQEDANWIYKTMILGHLMLFEWLEKTSFDSEVLKRLWDALAFMSGRLMARVQAEPNKHLGMDLVHHYALPRLVAMPLFLRGFRQETREYATKAYEGDLLAGMAKALVGEEPGAHAKIGIWGLGRRGSQVLESAPWIRERLVAAVDANPLNTFPVPIAPEYPESLLGKNIDILILAVDREQVISVVRTAMGLLQEGAYLICLSGCFVIRGGRAETITLTVLM